MENGYTRFSYTGISRQPTYTLCPHVNMRQKNGRHERSYESEHLYDVPYKERCKTPILILQTFPQVKRFFYSAAPSNLCTINNDLIYHRGTDLLFAPQGRSLIQDRMLNVLTSNQMFTENKTLIRY